MEERKKQELEWLTKDAVSIHRMRLDGFGFWTRELQMLHCGLFMQDLRYALRTGRIDQAAFRSLCSIAFGDNYAQTR